MSFILASASPRRKEILERAGMKVTVMPSYADEASVTAEEPSKRVMELALLKGIDVARHVSKNDYVISADTVVYSDKRILGKPKNREDAFNMLMSLSGKWHEVYTGYCVIEAKTGEAQAKYEKTRVKFRELGENEVRRYIDTREPMDKAGAYGIQGRGRLFVERIDGDFYNVVGLPVCALSVMLKRQFDIDIFDAEGKKV